MNTTTEKNEITRLIEVIENLNSRISAIEASMPYGTFPETGEVKKEVVKESSEDLEFRIGEQWFGKIGIIAFVFAFFYLLTLSFNGMAQTGVILFGFLTSVLMITASFYKSEQLKSLGGYITGSGIIILYFAGLKLHYFSENAAIAEMEVIIPLLFIISFTAVYLSLKRQSPALVMISSALFLTTALLSDNTAVIFISLILSSLGAVYINKKFNWESIVVFAIPATYLFFFLWLFNNPLTGRSIGAITTSPFSILLIPLFISIYGFTQAGIKNTDTDNYHSVVKTVLNASLGYLLFVYFTLTNNEGYSALLNFGISVLLLSIASKFWSVERSKISTFIYSMAGYGALSFAIILNFTPPDSYILLSWQSILVVSTALWFRSRFIVVANFFIFLILTITYLVSWSEYSILSLSFGLVALISARLINIHQLRLELQSEHLRNAYLVLAVLFIPFIFYSILPATLVGISWIILAFAYYLVGKMINNKKYRLMASATLIMSLVYIFIFGLTSADALYKILSFMLVSIALVIISVVYAKVRTREMSKT